MMPHHLAHKNFRSTKKGFTLIEIVICITVMGALAAGIFLTYQQILINSASLSSMTRAQELAQQRMELIIGQNRADGYTTPVFDPCSPGPGPAICTMPTGYSASVTQTVNSPFASHTLIVVTVTGPASARASLTTMVANY